MEMPNSRMVKDLPGFTPFIENWEIENGVLEAKYYVYWVKQSCETIELPELKDSCDLKRYIEMNEKNYCNRRSNLMQYHPTERLQLFLNDYFYDKPEPCDQNT
jgi:hypothetical protein